MGGGGSGTAGGELLFDKSWWPLTDRMGSVLGLVADSASGGGADWSPSERVEYSPYGRPRTMPRADAGGNGTVDFADVSAIYASYGKTLTQPGYKARADLSGDGAVGYSDISAVWASWGQAEQMDTLWSSGFEGASGGAGGAGHGCDVGYAGALWDPDLGLWQMRRRCYDPALGRWLTRDPAGYVDGMSLYEYVGSRPLMYFDPFGLGIFPQTEYRNTRYEVDAKGAVYRVEDAYKSGLFSGNFKPTGETRRTPVPELFPSDVRPDGTLRQDRDSGGAINTIDEVRKAQQDVKVAAGNEIGEQVATDAVGAAAAPIVGKMVGKAAGKLAGETVEEGVELTERGAAKSSSGRGMNNPACREAVEKGRRAHEAFKKSVDAKKGWKPNPTLETHDGRRLVPDAIDPKGRPVELKPDTPTGRAAGQRQLEQYKSVTKSNGRLLYYNPDDY